MATLPHDALALTPRRAIFDSVRREPGLHLRGIERALAMPFGQVLYHLDYLERAGVLVSRKDGVFRRYFVADEVDRRDKSLIAAFRHDVPRRVAVALLARGAAAHGELVPDARVAASTLSFHLAKMMDAGIVVRDGARYRLEDAESAARVLVFYRESFRDEAVDRFVAGYLATASAPVP